MVRGKRIAAAVVVMIAVTALGVPNPLSGSGRAPQRPNVIVIVTDDQDDTIFTPRLMPNTFRLLRDGGTRLSNFTIVSPLCCPSRAAQLTGQYGHNNGVLANDPGYPDLREPTNVLPAWLQAAGYQTAQVGRYLNNYSDDGDYFVPAPGWDRWLDVIDYSYRDYRLSVEGRKRRVSGGGPGAYLTRNLHRRANRIVGDLAAAPDPFYLQIDELAPHSDGDVQGGGRCAHSALPGPDKLGPVEYLHPSRKLVGETDVSDKPSFIRQLPPIRRRAFEDIQNRLRCRAAAIREADRGIGLLVDELKRTGIYDNTAIIFYSDNGFFSGEHRITKSKGLPYEESIQVPFGIRLPPALRGGDLLRKLDFPAANIDIVPTILDLAGAEPCTAAGECRVLDGRSLLPGLADPVAFPADRALLLEIDQRRSLSGGTLACTFTGVRQGDQVYVAYQRVAQSRTRECLPTDEVEHYRLDRDPLERRNLWPPRRDGDRAAQAELEATMERLANCAGNPLAPGPAPSDNPCE